MSLAGALATGCDRLGFILLLACAIWLPLPLGGNRPLFWSITQVGVFLLVLLASVTAILGRTSAALEERANLRMLWLLALWVGYVFFQALPLPREGLAWLSPGAYALYAGAGEVAGSEPAWTLSVYPEATRIEGMKYASDIGLLYAVLALVHSRGRLRALAVVLFAVGVLEALFGIWSASTGFRLMPERWLDGHFDLVTGTFVNRNHFAAHLAMALALGLGLTLHALAHADSGTPEGGFERLRALARQSLGPGGLWLLACAVVAAGLFASVSRGGLLAFAGGLFLVGGLTLARRGRDSMEGRWLFPLLAVIVAVAVVFGLTGVVGRLLESGADLSGRAVQWRLTLGMLPEYWPFGIGAGAYGAAFPAWQDGSLSGASYDHAHNDYLELIVEQGLVGALLLGAALFAGGRRIVSGMRTRHDRFMRAVLFGSALGLCAMLLHALVEFNFRIPANAGWFFLLFGMGLVAAGLDSHGHEPHSTLHGRTRHERRQ